MYKLPKSIDNLVDVISALPGVGYKSATKLAMHLVTEDGSGLAKRFVEGLSQAISDLSICTNCGNLVERGEDLCDICSSDKDPKLMIVESVLDLVNIENTGVFTGKYHVLGGIASPLRGIKLDDLNIDNLQQRIINEKIETVIFALPSNIEGDTTALLLRSNLENLKIGFMKLGRGLPSGSNIEYLDKETIRNSINNITEFV